MICKQQYQKGAEAPFFSQLKQVVPDHVLVDSGRSGLISLCRQLGIGRLGVPRWFCPAVIRKLEPEVQICFYRFDSDLKPRCQVAQWNLWFSPLGAVSCPDLDPDYTIFDLTQAFFHANPGPYTIRSTRKFFPVPDGGIVSGIAPPILAKDDRSPGGWALFSEMAEKGLSSCLVQAIRWEEGIGQGIGAMSEMTQQALSVMVWHKERSRRQENFQVYHQILGDVNRWPLSFAQVPDLWAYPLMARKLGLHRALLDIGVEVPWLWQGLSFEPSIEDDFQRFLTPLPLDAGLSAQRVEQIAQVTRKYVTV